MAFQTVSLPPDQWTLIGDNVTVITFQNQSQLPIYVSFTAANTAPTEEVGVMYPTFFGEVNTLLVDLTSGGETYVWARPSGGKSLDILTEA